MDTLSERAAEKFVSGCNCAQAVVWPFCDEIGLEADAAMRIACGFGGGIAKRQEVCGAVTGGIMVLGMILGEGKEQDRSTTEETYAKGAEFISRFESEHGSYNCLELLDGCDLNTEEGRKRVKDRDLRNETCKACVQTAVEILEEMIKNLSACRGS
ncbi:MAG: C-GCAxxG-C-C family protein [Phycisphaerae bacterium]|jgi:C_GCAxxG_C_C family probable redox protein|nr:C-GCAxxG-C-C family protein [Phycisphaerae bacterium]